MREPSGTAGTATGPAVSAPTTPTPKLSDAAATFAEAERGIGRETLERLGVVSATVFFPELDRKAEAVVFPYAIGGENVGWKARAIDRKAFVSKKGTKLAFWNLDRVVASLKRSPHEVFIVEGEFDACAMVEAGIPPEQVLSVPNGARERTEPDGEEGGATLKGYAYVDEGLRLGLSRATRFIWCGDADAPGHALRADMARMLGYARFHFLDWPEGCKDANQYLLQDGPEALRDTVRNGALPWPVKGLYRLSELPEPPHMITWSPGFPEWERKIMLAPRTLSVVTGHPGHGKTVLWTQLWYQVVKEHGVGACIASFETEAKPHLRRQLRTLITGGLEKDLTDDDRRRADRWIEERYSFVVHPDQTPTLQWFLDMAEVAIIRNGARIVQVDPWNRLDSARGQNESETEYIARCLRTLHVFAKDMNVHVQIVAHPAKMDSHRKGRPPELEDISGSKNWDNMVDQGFVVHRAKVYDPDTGRQTEAELHQKKARYEALGYPCKVKINFDLQLGRYVSADYRTDAGVNPV